MKKKIRASKSQLKKRAAQKATISDEEMEEEEDVSMEEKETKKKKIKSTAKKRALKRSKRDQNRINDSEDSSDDEDSDSFNDEEDNGTEVSFLPCREEEQKRIENYIKDGLKTTGSYNSLYIAGMPGTGKTASVTQVLKRLHFESEQGLVPRFNTLQINGMKYTNPSNVFRTIYESIFESKGVNIKRCVQILDTFFRNREEYPEKATLKDPTNPHIIMIIDEVDCLINQKQNLLYNIFNWTTYSKSKLIVISISNTLDLPNRLLPKIQSRMGNNKMMFKPYERDQLYKIISTKIEDVNLFSEDALRLCSMKVAAVNGDLRRILQICKRAKQLYILDKQKDKTLKKITKGHIIQASKDLFDSKTTTVIKSLQISEKIVLAALLYTMNDNEKKIRVQELFDKLDMFVEKAKEVEKYFELRINWEEFQMIIYNLVNLKILYFGESNHDNFLDNTVCTKFFTDEFMNTLEGQADFEPVFKLLQKKLND